MQKYTFSMSCAPFASNNRPFSKHKTIPNRKITHLMLKTSPIICINQEINVPLQSNLKGALFEALTNKEAHTFPKSKDSLAQLVEHNTFNVGVMGSSPMRVTKERKGI